MRKLFLALTMVVMCWGMTGCSSKITFTDQLPSTYEVKNTIILNKPFDSVWKATVSSVGESFFVLDNIEKDSGIISLSFSSNQPSDFIDCGQRVLSGKKLDGSNYDKIVDMLSSEPYLMSFNAQDTIIYHNSTLTGKANIIIQSIDKNSTSIKVNTRYICNFHEEFSYFFYAGFTPIPQRRVFDWTISFTGNETGTNQNKSTSCRSKFVIEQKIIDGIKKKLL